MELDSRFGFLLAASFSGGGARGFEKGPAFVPGEICRIFRSTGDKLINHYINVRTERVFSLLRKRFTTSNWIKHKEPREVHTFVDLLLQELDIQFLRTPLKETVEDEAAVDLLLDEVIVAAAERCLDPIPLEPPILDRLVQAKHHIQFALMRFIDQKSFLPLTMTGNYSIYLSVKGCGRGCSGLYGSSVFEDGKKILILLVDRSYCGETLYTYDAELNVWDGPRTVSLSDYTFPVNDLDLLYCNYKSFVINALWGSVKEAIQKPLGLMNVETLMENLEDPFDRGDVFPCSWHLIPLRGKKLCLLSLYWRRFDEIGYKRYFKTYVRFGTFELIAPQPEQTSASEPYQYDFKNKDFKFIDIAPDANLFLYPYDIVCSQV
ncbi:protein fat-free-like protein [Corchorus olitorius]|uniref:Vacuolar protein sorting-associated protein 51 homolog n=1 Tax=Corchorus olitorius TaxID=93759 RepID=A0A1R3HUI4_9ROSI|nr:protein fat-free-like protein [Corchorus olitorius]